MRDFHRKKVGKKKVHLYKLNINNCVILFFVMLPLCDFQWKFDTEKKIQKQRVTRLSWSVPDRPRKGLKEGVYILERTERRGKSCISLVKT